MCLYPTLIKNKKYTKTKKNGGNIPPVIDSRTLYVPVACQNCIECRKAKAREWQVRLLEDIKTNKNGKFITLTFSDESYNDLYNEIKNTYGEKTPKGYTLDNAIATQGVRWFLERWRKEYKKSLRHWLITELGHNGTNNIHLHGIVWADTLEKIEKIWKYGYVWKGNQYQDKIQNYVNEKTVNYITKYVTKIDEKHTQYKAKILTSPGIGGAYTTTGDHQRNIYMAENTNETYKTSTGHKVGLPIYWRNKIYTESQREQLWLQKLNKETRYVMKEKIDISKNLDEYHGAIKWYRKISKELGYRDNTIDYNTKEYEKQQREIQQHTRIKKAEIKAAKAAKTAGKNRKNAAPGAA